MYQRTHILKLKEDTVVEENLRSKSLYKFFLLLIKYLPFTIAFCTILDTVLSYYCIDLPIITYISGISLLPLIFMYLASYIFRFCIWHRIFLDYTVVSTLITIYDYYIGIPITDCCIVTLHLVLFFITITIALMLHLHHLHYDSKANK